MNGKVFVLTLVNWLSQTMCFGQQLPTKQQQYAFLQWYIDNYNPKKLSQSFQYFEGPDFKLDDFDQLRDTDMYGIKSAEFKLNDDDKVFLEKQITQNLKSRLIDKKMLQNADWKQKPDPAKPVTYISLPIFSADGNLAFINTSYYCGDLCGNGGVEIYKKVNGGWKRYEVRFWAQWKS